MTRSETAASQLVLLTSLSALLVTCLVTAQVIGSKLVPLPGFENVYWPAGTIAYAGTFLATDITSELYGPKIARRLVWVGFAMNFVLFALIYVAVVLPNSGIGAAQEPFVSVLMASGNIILGSLGAYLVSQHWDVFAFHSVRDRTGRGYLWLRNIASTGTSQFLDTVVFTVIAFGLAPMLFGVGHQLPLGIIGATIVGQYLLKLVIALLDTPLVYAAVGWVRRSDRFETTTDGVLASAD